MAYIEIDSLYDKIDLLDVPSAGSEFGTCVSIYDYWVAVSAPKDASDSGSVYLYKKNNNGEWDYKQKISETLGSLFGSSLYLYVDYLIIGSPEEDSGYFYFYEKDENDNWNYLLKQASLTLQSNEQYGKSVVINGEYIVCGSPMHDDEVGRAEVLSLDVSTVVSLNRYKEGGVSIVGEKGDLFGTSVSISEDYIFVGSPGYDSNKGAVYVYSKNELNVWDLSQILLSSDREDNDSFGCSISVYGDYVIIGAKDKTSDMDNAYEGAAYIFKNNNEIWYEIIRLNASQDEIINNPNYFGTSVCLYEDYAVVGSPGGNFVDVFYKKRNWGTFNTIISNIEDDDSFGNSVSIYGRNIICGSYLQDETVGESYVYENPLTKIRLAQCFEVNNNFLPSKASLYFKKYGNSSQSFFELYHNIKNVIDATNFSSIEQSSNKIFFDDRILNFTGNGYMIIEPEEDVELNGNNDSDFPILNYPIRSIISKKYNLWLRKTNSDYEVSSGSYFNCDILIDGIKIREIREENTSEDWAWVNTDFVLPDTHEHILGIRIKDKGSVLDKIYIDADLEKVPYLEGPDYSSSPFFTVHVKLYDAIDLNTPLNAYDYKTSIGEIKQDDWYNFNIKVLDNRFQYISEYDFNGYFFVVVSATGQDINNFVNWELIDSNEYLSSFSAIKIKNSNSIDKTETKNMLINNLIYYKAMQGDSDLEQNVWYFNYAKKHAFNIYSDFEVLKDNNE